MQVQNVIEFGSGVVLFEITLAQFLEEGLGDNSFILRVRFQMHCFIYKTQTKPFEFIDELISPSTLEH